MGDAPDVTEMIAAVKRRDRAGVETLLARDPALAGARAASGDSPVLLAVSQGASDIVDALLVHRPALNVFEAAAVGDVARLRDAVAAGGAVLATRSHDGWTPLHLAAFFGRADAVDHLLRAGADPRALSSNDHANTPLHAALAGRGTMRIVTALLSRGADVAQREGGGHTALHLAAFRDDVELVQVLLAHGADATARTNDGKTALRIAEEQGHGAVARRLRGEAP